jgi:hypothetical protein
MPIGGPRDGLEVEATITGTPSTAPQRARPENSHEASHRCRGRPAHNGRGLHRLHRDEVHEQDFYKWAYAGMASTDAGETPG